MESFLWGAVPSSMIDPMMPRTMADVIGGRRGVFLDEIALKVMRLFITINMVVNKNHDT